MSDHLKLQLEELLIIFLKIHINLSLSFSTLILFVLYGSMPTMVRCHSNHRFLLKKAPFWGQLFSIFWQGPSDLFLQNATTNFCLHCRIVSLLGPCQNMEHNWLKKGVFLSKNLWLLWQRTIVAMETYNTNKINMQSERLGLICIFKNIIKSITSCNCRWSDTEYEPKSINVGTILRLFCVWNSTA